MNLLVVGNGNFCVSNDGKRYTHESIGRLLLELKERSLAPIYVGIATKMEEISNDRFCLDDNNIETRNVTKKTTASLFTNPNIFVFLIIDSI